MSHADEELKRLLYNIIVGGESSEGQIVRPKWEDGTPAHTISIFGHVTNYDLSREFPAITVRKTAIRSAFDEILWIWQKKSNNIKDLKSHIWDEWADENGTIGKAYGYQLGVPYDFGNERVMDQVDNILWQLKNTPASRRMLTNIYNFGDLTQMGLEPCAYSMTFGVKRGRLHAILNQRSNDVIVANNWNVVQYALLVMMFAQVSGLKPGTLTHVIADAHIYDRHMSIAVELIGRRGHDAPKVLLNPDIKNFYDFTVDDLIVEDYITEPQIQDIPVAI